MRNPPGLRRHRSEAAPLLLLPPLFSFLFFPFCLRATFPPSLSLHIPSPPSLRVFFFPLPPSFLFLKMPPHSPPTPSSYSSSSSLLFTVSFLTPKCESLSLSIFRCSSLPLILLPLSYLLFFPVVEGQIFGRKKKKERKNKKNAPRFIRVCVVAAF